MKRTIWPRAFAACMLLTAAASCVQELREPDPYQSGDKISISLSVGLENPVQTRADGTPRISDGTRATTLIYALYKCVGTPEGLKDYELLKQERKDGVEYPYKITGLELVRGLDYKLVFWAQSPEGDRYYDTGDLKNIVVKYDDPWQQNNDEARDAFCKSYDFNDKILEQDHYTVTLRRPLAQINVGIARSEWETLQNNGIDIARSAINIAGVARKFDLVHDCILAPDDVTDNSGNGDTQGYTTANYGQSQIPHLQEEFGYPDLEIDLDRSADIHEDEPFIWASMCYILAGAPGTELAESKTTVDVTSLVLSYGENGEKELQPSGFPMNAVPVQANYRTNILFEHGLTGTARVTLELNRGYDNDYVSKDGGKTWNGEIAEGVRIKSYRGSTEKKKSHYGSTFFWVDFYVSNGKGLQWIADRSNGVPFSEKDIPTWTDKDGRTVTYERFRGDDGQPDVEKYKQAIFKILEGHALVPQGASSFDKLYRKDKDGNLIPWTFDDSSIILVADIDFSRDEATTGRYWAPIASKLAHESDENNTGPNYGYGFKGEFDGNGHTISHLRINNAEYNAGRPYYDETKGENTGEQLPWAQAAHNAGLIAVASDYATVKNLRLYDAEIIGEWNVGGLVGYYCRSSNVSTIGLTIENCQIENSRIAAIVSENNHDDDANCGGLVGSVSSRFRISNSSVINATLYSDFVIGGLIGVSVTYETSELDACKLKNSTLILNEYNVIGNSAYNRTNNGLKDYVQRSTDFSAPYYYAYTFGNQYHRTSASGSGVTECSNITLNIFYDYSKVNSAYLPASADLRGHSTVQNMPLNIFPLLDGRYGRSVTIGSHITGTPSYMTDDTAYGLYIDISEDPDWEWAKAKALKTDGFTLAGGETGDNRLYSLNVQPGTGVSATAGLGITGDKGTATVRDLILNGEPAIETGILLDKAKTVVLDNIAVYDVQYALADRAVPEGATLTVSNSDLRGITQYGSGYGSVTFSSTAFYPGSGTDENSQTGLCRPGSDTTFEGCVFREGFQFEIPAGVRVIFTNCTCGPASDPVALTVENIGDYLRSNQGTCIIDGRTVPAD